jgi:hypothetical protein
MGVREGVMAAVMVKPGLFDRPLDEDFRTLDGVFDWPPDAVFDWPFYREIVSEFESHEAKAQAASKNPDSLDEEENYFGCCPVCGGEGMGYLVNRKDYYVACDEHRICWYVGSGLVSPPEDSPEELESWYAENRAHLQGYRVIERSEATRRGQPKEAAA